MGKISRFCFLASLALPFATPALADDWSSTANYNWSSPANYNWSGIYIGGQIGAANGNLGGAFPDSPITFNTNATSLAGGAFIGFQHDFGSLVLGVEGGYLALSDSGRDGCNPADFCLPGVEIKGKIDEIWSIGPKLGWDAGRWMPYLTGGYANAAVETSLSVDSFSDRSYNRVDGWYFGGGLDMALDTNWKLGVEYRHYDFDSTLTSTTFIDDSSEVGPTVDSVTARLTYLFGRPSEPPAPLK